MILADVWTFRIKPCGPVGCDKRRPKMIELCPRAHDDPYSLSRAPVPELLGVQHRFSAYSLGNGLSEMWHGQT